MSLSVEPIEEHVEATLLGMTIAAGYDLPKNLALVTREPLDYDETNGKRPAAIIQITYKNSELIGLGGVGRTTLDGRVIVYFDTDTGQLRAATLANRYLKAIRDALLVDRSRGGSADYTTIPGEPAALLWKTGQALEATQFFQIVVTHEGAA